MLIYYGQFDVLLPEDAATKLQQQLDNGKGTLQYARVYMKPSEVIEGDFFNQYIKAGTLFHATYLECFILYFLGNILMLSSGRSGIDSPIISLADGVLRIEVDKATFERMGLEGKPIQTDGRKHVKARFAIELNLRLPSMLPGKNGFDRIAWAFKNVLNSSLTWLFCDLGNADIVGGPLNLHQPTIKRIDPNHVRLENALVPVMPDELLEEDYADAAELLEWISLAMMGSPRLLKGDDVDTFLSRYSVPATFGEPGAENLVRLSWEGLIPPSFSQKIFLAVLKSCGDRWAAVNGAAFSGEAYTILVTNGHSTTWQYKD